MTGMITARSRLGSLIRLWYYCGFGSGFLLYGYDKSEVYKSGLLFVMAK
jgi:hypothetical protein